EAGDEGRVDGGTGGRVVFADDAAGLIGDEQIALSIEQQAGGQTQARNEICVHHRAGGRVLADGSGHPAADVNETIDAVHSDALRAGEEIVGRRLHGTAVQVADAHTVVPGRNVNAAGGTQRELPRLRDAGDHGGIDRRAQ